MENSSSTKPDALGRLGVDYWHGWGVAQSYALAVDHFRMGAAGGDVPSNFWLGVALAEGKGAPKDEGAAQAYLTKAAQAGDSNARSYLDAMGTKGSNGIPSAGFAPKAYLVTAAGGGLASLAATFAFHQTFAVIAVAFVVGAIVGAAILWLLRPKPDAQAAALAAVANQQVHGSRGFDEGTI